MFFNVIRQTIVCPEFMVIFPTLLIFFSEPIWLFDPVSILSLDPDVVKYIVFVPAFTAFWCLRQSRIILFPSEDTKGIIQEWSKFKELKIRVLIGLSYQGMFCISSIVTWVLVPKLDNNWSVLVVGTAILGSLIGAITFYLATLSIIEIAKRISSSIG